jgi:hypothetical protein
MQNYFRVYPAQLRERLLGALQVSLFKIFEQIGTQGKEQNVFYQES